MPRKPADIAVVAVLVAMLVGAAGVATAVSWNKSFQVDEVEHIHASYHLRDGRVIYSEFWEGHNPLLYGFVTPLIDRGDPVGSFRRARVFMLLVLFGTVALSAYCARQLAGPWAAAITAGLLLLHTTYVERAIEVRPDGTLVFCTVLALAIELSSRPRLRRYALQAAAMSAAFLFTQKAVFVCFAFGCLWLASAIRDRDIKLVAIPMAVWTAPVALMIGVFALLGNLGDYFRLCWAYAAGQVTRTHDAGGPFPPWDFLIYEAKRNQFTTALVLVGLAYGAAVAGRATARRRQGLEADDRDGKLLFPTLLGVTVLAALKLNPFPFPYLHVTAIPVVVLLAGVFLARVPEELGQFQHRLTGPGLAIGAMLLASVFAVPRLLYKAESDTDWQMYMLSELDRIAAPDDKVFDMVGLYFREDAYPVFTMTHVIIAKYRLGIYPPMIPLLRENESVATMLTYRSQWLPRKERAFMSSHYVHYTGNLFVLGTAIEQAPVGREMRFDVLKEKAFRWDGDGAISVDGAPFVRGVLGKGVHVVRVEEAVSHGRLIMDTPEPYPALEPPRVLYKNFD